MYKSRSIALVLACVALLWGSARADERPLHLATVPDLATYKAYGEVVNAQIWGKFVIDLKEQRIYYFDPKLYPLHRDFVFAVLLNQPQTRAAIHEYNQNYGKEKPHYMLGYLAYHLKSGRWDYLSGREIRWTRAASSSRASGS